MQSSGESLVFEGGSVLRGRFLTDEPLFVSDGAISREAEDATPVDISGLLVAPGFVDLQINGALGHDFTLHPEKIGEVAKWLPSTGVTSFLPTVITTTGQRYENAMSALAHLDGHGARVLGLHFEGPMLHENRHGAHPKSCLRALSEDELCAWTPENGVRLVTIAPELEGALEIARRLVDQGVVVSMGHSTATSSEAHSGVDAGATMVTHLFNAMEPLGHREPGLVGEAFINEALRSGLIVDGIHLDPDVVALAWRLLGPERFILVTDAMAALGVGGERFQIGSMEVSVGSDGVRNELGVLAGSNLAMDQALRNLIEFTGCDVVEALQCASTTPAACLRASDFGALFAGYRADLVLLSDSLEVVATMVGGEFVFDRR